MGRPSKYCLSLVRRILQTPWDNNSSVRSDLILSLESIFAKILSWNASAGFRLCHPVAELKHINRFSRGPGVNTIDPEATKYYKRDLTAAQFITHKSQEAPAWLGNSSACTPVLRLADRGSAFDLHSGQQKHGLGVEFKTMNMIELMALRVEHVGRMNAGCKQRIERRPHTSQWFKADSRYSLWSFE